ncbi:hypothetical protein ACIBO9_28075 [Streptomyces prunicolor]|uniref:hypothetical protein n=1 Tax=Streptomyces prunicolor TaxID=67348 RepID=UPI0037CE7343
MSVQELSPPAVLLPPEVLHRADGTVVWHTGLVRSPIGAVLSLIIDAEQEVFADAGWEDFDPIGPAGVALRGPDSPGFLVPFPDTERQLRRYRVTGGIGPDADLSDACLEFWIRPLNLHRLRFLGEPGDGEALPFAVHPQVLYRRDGRIVWHPGVVRGPSGMFASLSVQAEGGEESGLLGNGWELGDRPVGAPLPLRITAQCGNTRIEISDSIIR